MLAACLRSARRGAVRGASAARALSGLTHSHATSKFADVPPIAPSDNIYDTVTASWAAFGDKVAVVDGITGESRTYRQIEAGIQSLAAHMQGLGLVHGDRIALVSPNHPDYATVLLAGVRLGLVVSPMNPTLTAHEMAVQLKDASIKMVIAAECCPQALEAAGMCESVRETLCIGAALDAVLAAGGEPAGAPAAVADDVSFLPYSSGTTGVPKGTMLSHRNIIANLHQMVAPDGDFYGDDAVLLSPLPMFHIYPLTLGLLFHLWHGTTYVSMSGPFSIAKFCELVEKYGATRAHVAPPVVLQLTKSELVDIGQLSSLRMVMSAAAPLGASLEQECSARIGCPIKQAWGMSELSPIATIQSDDDLRGGSLGVPVASTEIKVVGVDVDGEIIGGGSGQPVPIGDEGEMVVRGPQVMLGYLNAPGKTAECLLEGGWLRTGDVAKMDADGFLYITDRLKELIKYKGHQVAPAELEDLLTTHPAIADAAVIPVPDELAGELPRAYVVPKPGQAVDAEEVVQFVSDRVSAFKKLRGGVVVAEAIPKTGSGKILRRLVVQMDRERSA